MTPPLWHLRAARESRWAKYSSLPLQCQTQSPSRTLWSLDANPPLRTPLSTCHPLLRSEVTRVGRGRGKGKDRAYQTRGHTKPLEQQLATQIQQRTPSRVPWGTPRVGLLGYTVSVAETLLGYVPPGLSNRQGRLGHLRVAWGSHAENRKKKTGKRA